MKLFTLGLTLLTMGPNGDTPPSPPAGRTEVIAHSGPVHQEHWMDRYAAGLKAMDLHRWSDAKDNFKAADHLRHGDVERATETPGSPDEPNVWRDGAPYSPRFLSAYCDYRLALEEHDPNAQAKDFDLAATSFELLISQGERGRDTIYYLDLIYSRLNNREKREALRATKDKHRKPHSFKVDEEALPPEEVAAIQVFESTSVEGIATTPNATMIKSGASKNSTPTIQASSLTPGGTTLLPSATSGSLPIADVPQMSAKYALIIGEDGSQLGSTAMPFASYDAGVLKDGLISYAGYDPANVTVVQNGTTSQILDAAKALAAKVSQDATVLFYFAGPGVSVQGKDYISANDTTARFDTETMVAKLDLYQLFFLKGARLFSFYEVSRPIENGTFFGSESPKLGSVSQMEATIPDGEVTPTVSNGHMVGLFTEAFVQVLAELRSNQIPIYEFGWQIYNKMRRGNTGGAGGSAHQTPTLPVLNNLASDARF